MINHHILLAIVCKEQKQANKCFNRLFVITNPNQAINVLVNLWGKSFWYVFGKVGEVIFTNKIKV